MRADPNILSIQGVLAQSEGRRRSIVPTSNCIRTVRTRPAARPPKRSVVPKVESTRNWLQSLREAGGPSRLVWLRDNVTIFTRPSRFCPACAAVAPSPRKASTPTPFGFFRADRGHGAVSLQSALASGRWPFTAATSGAATKLKTSLPTQTPPLSQHPLRKTRLYIPRLRSTCGSRRLAHSLILQTRPTSKPHRRHSIHGGRAREHTAQSPRDS